MKRILVLTALIIVCVSGCSLNKHLKPETSALAGSDRDIHGCIGTAGYQWCERTNQCERPWELASKEGFENTLEKYDSYCNQ